MNTLYDKVEAQEFFDRNLAALPRPNGWSAAVSFNPCECCGHSALSIVFTRNETDSTIRVVFHGAQLGDYYTDLQERWDDFLNTTWTGVLERMREVDSDLEAGDVEIPEDMGLVQVEPEQVQEILEELQRADETYAVPILELDDGKLHILVHKDILRRFLSDLIREVAVKQQLTAEDDPGS